MKIIGARINVGYPCNVLVYTAHFKRVYLEPNCVSEPYGPLLNGGKEPQKTICIITEAMSSEK